MVINRINVVHKLIILTSLMMSYATCLTIELYQKRLYVFGDSLFDTGNNQYLHSNPFVPANHWPYGMSWINATGRFSDGRLVPDFVALKANLSYPIPFLAPDVTFIDGANFASAGSGALEGHRDSMNLRMQLSNFKNLAESMAKVVGEENTALIFKKSVFFFSMGGNDYFDFNSNNVNPSVGDQARYVGDVISNMTMAFEEIYDLGGRKFAIQDVGPLGCLPMIKDRFIQEAVNDACISRFSRHARLHNAYLRIILQQLQLTLPGFKYTVFDYYNSLKARIDSPENYGLKEGKIACCGNGEYNGGNCGGGDDGTKPYELCSDPSEYIFFDGGHTTETFNIQLAEQMWNGTNDVIAPYNLNQLFGL